LATTAVGQGLPFWGTCCHRPTAPLYPRFRSRGLAAGTKRNSVAGSISNLSDGPTCAPYEIANARGSP